MTAFNLSIWTLALVALGSCANAFLWFSFTPIRDFIDQKFQVPSSYVDFLSTVYLIIFLPFALPASSFIQTQGIRTSAITGSLFTTAGAWLRYVGARDLQFYVLLSGQALAGIGSCFFIGLTTRVATVWFDSSFSFSASSSPSSGGHSSTTSSSLPHVDPLLPSHQSNSLAVASEFLADESEWSEEGPTPARAKVTAVMIASRELAIAGSFIGMRYLVPAAQQLAQFEFYQAVGISAFTLLCALGLRSDPPIRSHPHWHHQHQHWLHQQQRQQLPQRLSPHRLVHDSSNLDIAGSRITQSFHHNYNVIRPSDESFERIDNEDINEDDSDPGMSHSSSMDFEHMIQNNSNDGHYAGGSKPTSQFAGRSASASSSRQPSIGSNDITRPSSLQHPSTIPANRSNRASSVSARILPTLGGDHRESSITAAIRVIQQSHFLWLMISVGLIRGASRGALNDYVSIMRSIFITPDYQDAARWIVFAMLAAGALGALCAGFILDGTCCKSCVNACSCGCGDACCGCGFSTAAGVRSRLYSRRVGGWLMAITALGAVGVLAIGVLLAILENRMSFEQRIIDEQADHEVLAQQLFCIGGMAAALFGFGTGGASVFAMEHALKQQLHNGADLPVHESIIVVLFQAAGSISGLAMMATLEQTISDAESSSSPSSPPPRNPLLLSAFIIAAVAVIGALSFVGVGATEFAATARHELEDVDDDEEERIARVRRRKYQLQQERHTANSLGFSSGPSSSITSDDAFFETPRANRGINSGSSSSSSLVSVLTSLLPSFSFGSNSNASSSSGLSNSSSAFSSSNTTWLDPNGHQQTSAADAQRFGFASSHSSKSSTPSAGVSVRSSSYVYGTSHSGITQSGARSLFSWGATGSSSGASSSAATPHSAGHRDANEEVFLSRSHDSKSLSSSVDDGYRPYYH